MGILIGLLIALLLVMAFVIRNLLSKLEATEDYIDKLSVTINYIDNRLKEIDSAGIFESDDEIGWFFKEIKNLGDHLDQYKLK